MKQKSSRNIEKRRNEDGSISTLINGVEIMRERVINPNDKFIEL